MTNIPNDQRRNLAIREISQSGFDALLVALTANDLGPLVTSLRGMGKVEDVMRKSPAMVGLLISMAWKLRATPTLTPFFQACGEGAVTLETDPIAPCGRSFQDIRKSHLLGTARLYFAQQSKASKTTPSRGWVHKLLAAFSRKSKLGQAKATGELVSYATIKPQLLHHGQFALIPCYAQLPQRQAALLGCLLPAVTSTQALTQMSKIEAGNLKTLVRVAQVFASTVLGIPRLTDQYMSVALPLTGGAVVAVDDLVAGHALNGLLSEYCDVIDVVAQNEEAAINLVKRLAVCGGVDVWAGFRNTETANNIRFCPEPIAQILGAQAGFMHDAVSASLANAKNLDAMGLIVADMIADIGLEGFKTAAGSVSHVKVWDDVVNNLNRAQNLESGADLTLPKSKAAIQSIVALALRGFQPVLAAPPYQKAA